jgi:hypothetical protein
MTAYEKAAIEIIAKVIQTEAEHQWYRRNGYSADESLNPVPEEDLEMAKGNLFKILDDLLNPPANYS